MHNLTQSTMASVGMHRQQRLQLVVRDAAKWRKVQVALFNLG